MGTVLTSEWIKLRSLRSTWFCLLGAVVAVLAIAPFNANSDYVGLGGILLAQLLIGVLGVLSVTGEYATGMIRSSFGAVPRRAPVLVAKAAVYSAVAFVVSLVTLFAASSFARVHRHRHPFPARSECLRAVLAGSVYLALLAMLAVGLGFVIRSTAGAVSALFGFVFVVPIMMQMLTMDSIGKFLPYDILSQATSPDFQRADWLTPWGGIAALAAWTFAALFTAWSLVQRRDA
jgi:hypothetical protein